eukprot:tig00000204_g17694.t1
MPPAAFEGAGSVCQELFKPLQERVRDLQALTILRNAVHSSTGLSATTSALNQQTLSCEKMCTHIQSRLTSSAESNAIADFAECSQSILDYAIFLSAAAGLGGSTAAAAPAPDLERGPATAAPQPAPAAAPAPREEKRHRITIERVTQEEFMAVGQHLRGRLALAAVNSAIDQIEEILREKHAILAQNPNKLHHDKLAKFKAWAEQADALEDIKGPYLTDEELGGSVFKADATGRSIQTVLRSVQPPRMRVETRSVDKKRVTCYLFPL